VARPEDLDALKRLMVANDPMFHDNCHSEDATVEDKNKPSVIASET
jgi:hypothetical protein